MQVAMLCRSVCTEDGLVNSAMRSVVGYGLMNAGQLQKNLVAQAIV